MSNVCFSGSLIVYAVILNQKLINKSRKKERNFKQYPRKKRKKDSDRETVKLNDIDRPFTMVNTKHLLYLINNFNIQ